MSKNITAWAAAAKSITEWVGVGREVTEWSDESIPQVGYLYDSSLITYDNSFTYDYIAPVTNQSNDKNITAWIAS